MKDWNFLGEFKRNWFCYSEFGMKDVKSKPEKDKTPHIIFQNFAHNNGGFCKL